jgi:hypothetical protein
MFCPNCGKENTGGNNFCQECGKAITNVIETKRNVPMQVAAFADTDRLTLIGSGLLVVAFFMNYISFPGGWASVSGFELIRLSLASGDSGAGLIALFLLLIPISGGVTLYFSIIKHRHMRKAANAAAVLGIIMPALLIITGIFSKDVKLGQIFSILGIGMYLNCAGVVCLAIAGYKDFKGQI